MKSSTGRRKDGVVRRVLVLGIGFMLFAIQPSLGDAAVLTDTFSRADISVTGSAVEFYDYTGGTTNTWANTADFDAGAFSNTNSTDVAGSVVLDRIGPAGVAAPDPAITWWDTDWANRRCYEIDHTTAGAVAVTEYPIRVLFPIETMVADGFVQADFGDLRAIAADGTTSLPLWVDDTEPDVLWIQVDDIAAATTSRVCVYFGYQPGGATIPVNHTEDAVFTYTAPRDLYYAVSDVFTTPGAAINVVSYIDGNEVSLDGGAAVTLAVGDVTTFDAVEVTAGSVLSALGPLAATGVGSGTDSLVPISFAGTLFTAPIARGTQTYSFIAPFGDAMVSLYDGTTLVDTFTVTTGTPYTDATADITPGNTAIIESDLPVLVTHRETAGGDSLTLYPARAGDFYTVRSTETVIGYATDGTNVDASYSDGTTAATVGARGTVTVIAGGGNQGGTAADGLRLTADQPVGVIGLEDGDGTEAFATPPASELSSHYWIATDSQYVAFACPTTESADVPLTLTASGIADRPITCAGGSDVAWTVDTADLAVTTTGISVSSDNDQPFFAYYEDLASDGQVGLLGPKQARQYTWPEPIVTAGPDEGLFRASGAWESATLDVGAGNEIYGFVSLAGNTPAGTDLRVQIATIAGGTPSDFVGPDGTAATSFTTDALPAVADFGHDGERLLRVRAVLETTDPTVTPQLDQASVDSALRALDRSLNGVPTTTLTTSIDPTVTTSYLLRVKTLDPGLAGSEATAVYRGAVNAGNLAEETIRFVNTAMGIDSVQQSMTTAVDPPALFQADHPYSIVLDHAAVGSGTSTVAFAWQLDYQGGHSIYLETDFGVEVTAR